ncbi:extracellular solute-binding protein [Streptomyces sp. 549]|uniref:extracellular solute-binding protein n=1 Tax=Streptomyces sp. 549 TaxID=3049076 RepID=UPI0024C31EDF|nr:extracellular solute-binding protein [Streptomyces sp. 549]MDK1475217.1 extracellular solute-binding protein [Streptomyces sp. 549]
MRRRRFTHLAAAGLAGAAVPSLVSCGAEAASAEVTLTLVAADYGDLEGGNGSQEYWDGVVRAFEAQHEGIRVDVTVHSWDRVAGRVQDLVKKGRSPDLAQIDSYAGYAADDLLYRAQEVLTLTELAAFQPFLAAAGEVRRTQYGLPFLASTRMLLFNRALFTRAGLDPQAPPRTWAEVREAAAALRDAGVNVPYGLPLGPEEAHAEAMTWMVTNGGGFTGPSGGYTLDAEANVETLVWLRDELVGRGLTTANPATTDRQNLFDLFTRGQVGMLNGTPSLMRDAARKKIDYGVARLPGPDGPSRATLGGTDWLMAFRHNGHREEISTFLGFVYRLENHYALAERYNLLPVTTAAADRMRSDKAHRELWEFLDGLPEAEFFPVAKAGWSRTSQEARKAVGAAVAPGGRPERVLQTLQRSAEAGDQPRNG